MRFMDIRRVTSPTEARPKDVWFGRIVACALLAAMPIAGCSTRGEASPSTPATSTPAALFTAATSSTPIPSPEPSPDAGDLAAAYVAYIDGLPDDTPGSVAPALEELKKLPAPIADGAVDAFFLYLDAVCRSCDIGNEGEVDEAELAKDYIRVFYAEGMGNARGDRAAVGKELRGLTSPEYAAYFDLTEKLAQRDMLETFGDAALRISWKDFADCIAWKGAFCETYAAFAAARGIADDAQFEARIYLGYGEIDNTQVYGFSNGTLENSVKDSYAYYLSEYPESTLAPRVEEALGVWSDNGFKHNDAVKTYLESHKDDILFS